MSWSLNNKPVKPSRLESRYPRPTPLIHVQHVWCTQLCVTSLENLVELNSGFFWFYCRWSSRTMQHAKPWSGPKRSSTHLLQITMLNAFILYDKKYPEKKTSIYDVSCMIVSSCLHHAVGYSYSLISCLCLVTVSELFGPCNKNHLSYESSTPYYFSSFPIRHNFWVANSSLSLQVQNSEIEFSLPYMFFLQVVAALILHDTEPSPESDKHNDDIIRLTQRHWPARVQPTESWSKRAKRCRVCSARGKRGQSVYYTPLR